MHVSLGGERFLAEVGAQPRAPEVGGEAGQRLVELGSVVGGKPPSSRPVAAQATATTAHLQPQQHNKTPEMRRADSMSSVLRLIRVNARFCPAYACSSLGYDAARHGTSAQGGSLG